MRSQAKATTAGSTLGQASRQTLLGLCIVGGLLLASFLIGPAQAADPIQESSLGFSGSEAGAFSNPAGVAVRQSTGDVYVVDQNNNRVERFDSTGSFIATFGDGVNQSSGEDVCTAASGDTCQAGSEGSGDGAFSSPQGIAIDQSSGDIYVVDAGNRRIQKFSASGIFQLKWGAPGTGNGEFSSWGDGSFIATNAAGHVFVGDGNANPRIQEFNSSGAFIAEITGTNSQGVTALAIDSGGNLYNDDGQTVVHKLNSAGAQQYDLAATAPRALAVDPSTDDVYVGDAASGYEILRYDSTGAQVGSFGQGVIGGSRGIAWSTFSDQLYAADPGCDCVRVFGSPPPQQPTVGNESITEITLNSATLNGTVNPNGADTTYYFEYGPTTSYGTQVPIPAPGTDIGDEYTDQAVSVAVSGLTPGAAYHFRIVAINSQGTVQGDDVEFRTSAQRISRTWATQVIGTHAVIDAAVDPAGLSSTLHFEWGTDASYGHATPSQELPAVDTQGYGVQGIPDLTPFAQLDGLAHATTYHYRAVLEGPGGTLTGPDRSFTTFSEAAPFQLPEERAYEMVSPLDKNGGNITTKDTRTQASVDGNAIAFISPNSFADSVGTLGYHSEYLARRTADGWVTHNISPPQEPVGGFPIPPVYPDGYVQLSPDLSKGVIFAPKSISEEGPDVQKVPNLYLRDNLLNGPPPSYTLLSDCLACAAPLPESLGGDVQLAVGDASADMTHVLFDSRENLVAGASGDEPKAYEWDGGVLRLAGVLPDSACGTPPCIAPASVSGQGAGAGGAASAGEKYLTDWAMSEDGRRIFFTAAPFSSLLGAQDPAGDLYMREDHTTTVQINASERTDCAGDPTCGGDGLPDPAPDPAGHQPAAFRTATPDGSHVLFISAEQLVDADDNSQFDLYEYDADAPSDERLTLISEPQPGASGGTTAPRAEGVFGLSNDGSFVYFSGRSELVPGQPEPGQYINSRALFAWHDGTVRFIDNYESNTTFGQSNTYPVGNFEHVKHSRVSADGNTLVFVNNLPTNALGYDTRPGKGTLPTPCIGFDGGRTGCEELFVYRYPANDLKCASCNPTNAAPVTDAAYNQRADWPVQGAARTRYQVRALSGDSSKLFFNSVDPLVPEDTNGHYDAYQYLIDSGKLRLLSTGQCDCNSYFVDASADARDIFITTPQPLVGIDKDSQTDLYDVRAGGGIAAQNPLATFQCQGDACQPLPVVPNDPTPGSASNVGPGNVVRKAAHKRAKRCGKGRHKAKVRGKARCIRRKSGNGRTK